jgi:hypothetical protein
MHSKAISAPAYLELPSPEMIGDEDVNCALLSAMRLWAEETQEARDAEEEHNSRLRQLMN